MTMDSISIKLNLLYQKGILNLDHMIKVGHYSICTAPIKVAITAVNRYINEFNYK